MALGAHWKWSASYCCATQPCQAVPPSVGEEMKLCLWEIHVSLSIASLRRWSFSTTTPVCCLIHRPKFCLEGLTEIRASM